jgi:SAM-dependent MidA family methyltransferase
MQLFQKSGLFVHGPITQGDFLKAIGLMERTEQLCALAIPEQSSSLKTAAVRLTHHAHMGSLFKAIAVTASDNLELAGF